MTLRITVTSLLASQLDGLTDILAGLSVSAYICHVSNKQNEKQDKQLPGIDVLNTGYGDFELRFDPDKPDEVEKAKQTITDMLKRGYAIFVHEGKETRRVRKFDVEKNVYVIGSTPAEEVPIAQTRATAVGRSAGG